MTPPSRSRELMMNSEELATEDTESTEEEKRRRDAIGGLEPVCRHPSDLPLCSLCPLWLNSLTNLVGNPPVLLRPRDAVAGVQAGEDELDARRPHGGAVARVDLERLLPRLRHALEPLGVVG